jgi:ribosomal RNA-processing protein 17
MAPPNSKRRKTVSATPEVLFDESARSTYLTGFSKRKQDRIKNARELAIQREKEERITHRAEVSVSNEVISVRRFKSEGGKLMRM